MSHVLQVQRRRGMKVVSVYVGSCSCNEWKAPACKTYNEMKLLHDEHLRQNGIEPKKVYG